MGFKLGDIVECVWKEKTQNHFTVGKKYVIGGGYFDESRDDHFGVIKDDMGENNGHILKYVKMELVKGKIINIKEPVKPCAIKKSTGQVLSLAVKNLVDSDIENIKIKVDNYIVTIKKEVK